MEVEVISNIDRRWMLLDIPIASNAPRLRTHDGTSTISQIFLINYNSPDLSLPIKEFIDLNELIDFRYKLKKPLKVMITHDGYDTIGEIPELGIYAFGDNQFEVLREINKDTTELFEELDNHTEDKLGTLPKKWKRFLAEYLEKGVGD